MQEQGLYGGIVGFIHLFADHLEQAGGKGGLLFHGLHGEIVYLLNILQDLLSLLGAGLTAMFPIDLIAVIGGGVMASGDHNAGFTVEMQDGKGKLRHGMKGIV